MARIRTIKPEFCTSEQIVECSTSARLLFICMWCFCDDGGVHPASIKRLKMEVFPGDSLADDDIQAMVNELLQVGLIVEFEAENERFWHVSGWDKHQKIDRPTMKYPRPTVQNSTSPRRAIDERSTSPRDGMEWNGMERNGDKEGLPETAPPTDGQSGSDKKTKRFVKPTLAEVTEYCRERNNSVDPAKFIDFYESKGWVVGKSRTPMKDWKAAIRSTWETSDTELQASRPAPVIRSVEEEQADRQRLTGGRRM